MKTTERVKLGRVKTRFSFLGPQNMDYLFIYLFFLQMVTMERGNQVCFGEFNFLSVHFE